MATPLSLNLISQSEGSRCRYQLQSPHQVDRCRKTGAFESLFVWAWSKVINRGYSVVVLHYLECLVSGSQKLYCDSILSRVRFALALLFTVSQFFRARLCYEM